MGRVARIGECTSNVVHALTLSLSWICSAPDDIEQVEHIRSLLEDLQNVRQDKIRNGLFRISNDVQSGGTAYAIQVQPFATAQQHWSGR